MIYIEIFICDDFDAYTSHLILKFCSDFSDIYDFLNYLYRYIIFTICYI